MSDTLTPERLEAMLTEYGWTYETAGYGRWRTGFAGEQRVFPLEVCLNETCISFAIEPFVELEPPGRGAVARARELRQLLEMNDRLQVAKLGIGESGDVTLSCQALARGFDIDALSRLLGIMAYYADSLSAELGSDEDSDGRHGDRPLLS